MDKFWNLKSRLTIAMADVRGTTSDPSIASEHKCWRGPDARVPGVIVAGTFHQDGNRVFWDVHNKDKAIVEPLRTPLPARMSDLAAPKWDPT